MNRSLFFRSSWQLMYFTAMNLIVLTPIAFLFRVNHLKSLELINISLNLIVLIYIILSLNAFFVVFFYPVIGLSLDSLILPQTLLRKERQIDFEDIQVISKSKNRLFPNVVLNIKGKKYSISIKRKQIELFTMKLNELKSLRNS